MIRSGRPVLIALLAVAATAAAAASTVFAGGRWAAIKRDATCEAATQSLRQARRGQVQARSGFAFDQGGPRQGQFYALLSRMPRDGATVLLRIGDRPFLLVRRGQWAWSRGPGQEAAIIEAARAAAWMHVETRDRVGRRLRDDYSLDGAPTAIDAAAAACAVVKRPPPN